MGNIQLPAHQKSAPRKPRHKRGQLNQLENKNLQKDEKHKILFSYHSTFEKKFFYKLQYFKSIFLLTLNLNLKRYFKTLTSS